MKLMRNILNTIKPHFDEGGKLNSLYPAYDAFETFLFVPNHTTSTGAHIRDSIDLKRTMVMVIIALIPCVLFGMWNAGYQYYNQLPGDYTFWDCFLKGAILFTPLIVVSYVVGLSIEFAFAVNRRHQVNEGYLVTGMLIPLTMPIDVPLWMLALSVAFAVIIGKEVFGGTGMNILNPALTARAFLFFAYPTWMSGNKVWVHGGSSNDPLADHGVDAISGETALGNLASKIGLKSDIGDTINLKSMDYDQMIQDYAEPFSYSGEYSLINSFLGIIPGSVGETSVLAILIGAIILLVTGVGSRVIMSSMFIGGLSTAYLLQWLAPTNNLFMQLDPIHQLCLGGFFFGMVFMATDPVSAAQTNIGKMIYGFLCGALTIIIRIINPAYPEGVMVAILFMNVMAPLIDHYVVQVNINRRLKRLKKIKINE